MLLSEIDVMKYLLTKGEIVNSKKMAHKFGCSVYEVAMVMKSLKKRGVVRHIRARKWEVDRDVLKDEIDARSVRKLVVVDGKLLHLKCEACFNEHYWSEVIGDDGIVECHHCGHKQKRS